MPVARKKSSSSRKPSPATAGAGTRKKKTHPVDPALDKVRRLARAAFDKKALDILALDVRNVLDYAEYLLLLSANTEQQIKAVWQHVEGTMKEQGFTPLVVEGQGHNRWVLMDYRDVMVHIFLRPLRELYELERLWGDAPRVDLGLPEAAPPSEDSDLD